MFHLCLWWETHPASLPESLLLLSTDLQFWFRPTYPMCCRTATLCWPVAVSRISAEQQQADRDETETKSKLSSLALLWLFYKTRAKHMVFFGVRGVQQISDGSSYREKRYESVQWELPGLKADPLIILWAPHGVFMSLCYSRGVRALLWCYWCWIAAEPPTTPDVLRTNRLQELFV